MIVKRIYTKVNPAGTINADGIESLIKYKEDCIHDEDTEYYDTRYYDTTEKGEICKKGTACYLAYCISVKNDAKNKNGGVIKFDSALLPTVFEFMEKNDDQDWIRLLIDENGGKSIWSKHNNGIWQDVDERWNFGDDAFEKMLVRMGLKEEESHEMIDYNFDGEPVKTRDYILYKPFDIENKDGDVLLEYREDPVSGEPLLEDGVIHQKGQYCYLNYSCCPDPGCESFYGTVKFDSSLLAYVYELLESNNQEYTIYGSLIDKGGEWLKSDHIPRYYEYENE